jgi:hypothetical protein
VNAENCATQVEALRSKIEKDRRNGHMIYEVIILNDISNIQLSQKGLRANFELGRGRQIRFS